MNPITVFIIENEKMPAEAICSNLGVASRDSIKCIGFATDSEEGVKQVLAKKPDIALVDLGLDRSKYDGLSVGKIIRNKLPSCRLIVLTKEERIFQPVLIALEIGFTGYVTKDRPIQSLISTIETVYRNGTDIGSNLTSELAKPNPFIRINELTPTEKGIARLISSKSASNKLIAAELHTTEQNVRNAASRIYDKLGLSSRLELAAYIEQLKGSGLSSLLYDLDIETF